MERIPFKTVDEGLTRLQGHEKALMEIGHRTLTAAGGALYPVDFCVMGAVKRGLAVTSGFRVLIDGRNLLCAGALLRMQLETAFRFFGLSLVERPQDAALAVISGTHMKKLKSREGVALTDSYLADELSKHYPWVKSVFVETSKFVHFTEKQIFAGLVEVNDQQRTFEMFVSANDAHVPEATFLEALNAFDETTNLLGEIIGSWRDSKMQAPSAMRPNTR